MILRATLFPVYAVPAPAKSGAGFDIPDMTKRTTALRGFFVHAQPVYDGLGRGAARLAGSFVAGMSTLPSPSPLFDINGGGFSTPTKENHHEKNNLFPCRTRKICPHHALGRIVWCGPNGCGNPAPAARSNKPGRNRRTPAIELHRHSSAHAHAGNHSARTLPNKRSTGRQLSQQRRHAAQGGAA